jgi:hypothetical protein
VVTIEEPDVNLTATGFNEEGCLRRAGVGRERLMAGIY